MLFIGLDDTDNLDSRGTGRLARHIAATLSADYALRGVVRHQLLVDHRVRCTRNNSAAAILLDTNGKVDAEALFKRVKEEMLSDFQPGSDPGLCVAWAVPAAVTEFAQRAKRELVTESEARALAAASGILLDALGGDGSGVIGALAAVGLAAAGDDGRYILVGRSRGLSGLESISEILAAGIAAVQTAAGQPVTKGLVRSDKLRPARRGGRPVLVVKREGDHWSPLKLD